MWRPVRDIENKVSTSSNENKNQRKERAVKDFDIPYESIVGIQK